MSITGNIYFYSVQEVELRKALNELLVWAGAKDRLPQHSGYIVSRSIGPNREWEYFNADLRGDDVPSYRERIEVFYEHRIDQFATYLKPDTHVSIDLSAPPRGHKISEAIQNDIPPEIRDTFAPGDVFLNLGYSDVFDASSEFEHVGGRFISRPFTAVQLFGYGCPKDWAKMRELTPQLPEIVAVRKELSAILGPIHMAMLWDV